jgi:ethanolamine utilization cobalamin adenosyltransferase
MSVLTECKLRRELRGKDIKEYRVKRQDIITPAARAYLSDKNIKLIIVEEELKQTEKSSSDNDSKKSKGIIPRYENIQGGFFENKPEFMTQLYGNKLVYKDHPKIELRGKLDSMQAEILQIQVLAQKSKKESLVKDLEEVLGVVRKILRAEVLGEKLENFTLLGMKENEIREISHNPKKYFNREHIFPNYKMGELVIALNGLRTKIREVEICALKAFKNNDGEISRPDIIRYLNRLSSCFYVMMLKYEAGYYK